MTTPAHRRAMRLLTPQEIAIALTQDAGFTLPAYVERRLQKMREARRILASKLVKPRQRVADELVEIWAGAAACKRGRPFNGERKAA